MNISTMGIFKKKRISGSDIEAQRLISQTLLLKMSL
jgi:hypothetical protein